MRRAHDVPDPGREPAGARAAQSAQSSLLHQARAGGHGPQPDLVLGYHPAPGAQTLDVLLPLCLARHLQPLRRGLDGCRSGERRARRDADRGNLSQARHRAPGAHPAFGPRRADDQQVHRPTPRRPRGHPLSEPPPGQRRQPLLRGAVQDPEPTFPICHPNSWNSCHFPTAKGTVSPYAAIRWHDFGNRPALGRPLGHFSRHPDTPLLSLSPRRRFPRPTPERVFVADHQSSSGFSGTGPSAPPPQPIGT